MSNADILHLDEASGKVYLSGSLIGRLNFSERNILCHLIRKEGEICTKDELIHAGWKGRFVVPNSLNISIKNIRVILNIAGKEDALETIPKIGFRIEKKIMTLICDSEGNGGQENLKKDNPPEGNENEMENFKIKTKGGGDSFVFEPILKKIVVFCFLFFLISLFIIDRFYPVVYCNEFSGSLFCGAEIITEHDVSIPHKPGEEYFYGWVEGKGYVFYKIK